ncbi:MAG: nodulation protein NfeD [Elusimicrobia bacterium]|nr:nodulation protein NfeD [Elusimicrobiota bacterium]MBU2614154.1 nodulation protein NfeD [Elusimicrobiota bacterium]
MKFIKYLFIFNLLNFTLAADKCYSETYLMEIDGIINPVVADYISDGFKTIKEKDTVIIRMNTPGGLMDSMQQIIKSMLNSPNPVIVWIGPPGTRAASAGVFITMASDIACMAPETNIGAAHPVQMGGGAMPGSGEKDSKQDKVMEGKITNDAAAYMRSIAGEKKRNWKWAEESVTKSLSITSREALDKKVIEYIFPNLDELREKLDSKKIKKLNKEFTVHTKGDIKTIAMKPFKKFLNMIAHPNIAFIFLTLGVYGLIYEFSSPGIGLGAIVGGICLILAFFSMQLLPVNTAGLLMLILGLILMAVDVFNPTVILTIGGLISFVMGGLMLFDFQGKFISISVSLVLTVALASLLFFIFVVRAVVKVRKRKITTGKEGLIGDKGTAKNNFSGPDSKGMVFIQGELWSAQLVENSEVKEGDSIEVVDVVGNLLKIKKG